MKKMVNMKSYLAILLALSTLTLSSCGSKNFNLSVQEMVDSGAMIELSIAKNDFSGEQGQSADSTDDTEQDQEENQEQPMLNELAYKVKHDSELTWEELDQISLYGNFRKEMDEVLENMKFDKGSKNGYIFSDTTGMWTGNNTLMNAFYNKAFDKDIWSNSDKRSAMSQIANKYFIDTKGYDMSVGVIAAVNGYWNIFPADADGKRINLARKLSRAELLAGIYRADTPVVKIKDNVLTDKFGWTPYNKYAEQVLDISYMKLGNSSLNSYTYCSNACKAEALYSVIQRYYKDVYDEYEVSGTELNGFGIKYLGDLRSSLGYNENTPMWEIYDLETCIQQGGLSDDLYKACCIAIDYNITSDVSDWKEPVSKYGLLQMLLNTYNGFYEESSYPVNTKYGKTPDFTYDSDTELEKIEVGKIEGQDIVEALDLDSLFNKYTDVLDMTDEEIEQIKMNSDGYTFEQMDTYLTVDNCEYLNFRTGPSTAYDILRTIDNGTEVHIIARCIENGWYRVVADGVIGYQCGYYFSDKEPTVRLDRTHDVDTGQGQSAGQGAGQPQTTTKPNGTSDRPSTTKPVTSDDTKPTQPVEEDDIWSGLGGNDIIRGDR